MKAKKKIRRSTIATALMLWFTFSMFVDILLTSIAWSATTGGFRIALTAMAVVKTLFDIVFLWICDEIRAEEKAKEAKTA